MALLQTFQRLGLAKAETDEQLMQRVLHADVKAYAILVERYHLKLYQFVWYQFEQPSEAEDIVQEVFLKLWQRPQQFDVTKASFKTWLFRLAHNQAISHWRKHQRHEVLLESADALQELLEKKPWHLAPEDNSPLKQLLQQQQAEELKQKIDTLLPVPMKAIVILYYLEEMSQKAIASSLGISVRAVEANLYRAKYKLRQSYNLTS